MVPGQITELNFALIPTSVLLRKGHRIRLAIGCADDPTFGRLPAEGDVQIRMQCNQQHASWIDLPVFQS